MRPDELRALLGRVRRGAVTPAAAARAIAEAPIEQLEFATLDHQRALRNGVPEVVFGPGKSVPDLVAIVRRLYARNGLVLATRVSREGSDALLSAFPEARRYERSGLVVLRRHDPKPRGRVLVVCAGTSDLPVAEEAAVTAETLGSRVEQVTDVGVAGLHRLLAHREKLRGARVVVVAAGLEGALPSVVGGLVDRPVIAVPTSVGYGAHFGGLAPLLAMLNSCAPGVTVVNVNNGFGAGYAAHLVNVGAAGARAAGAGEGLSLRIAFFDCFSGISGDMCLAALVSAGWPFDRLESLPRRLGLEGVRVSSEPARRGPFAALKVAVAVERDQPHRHLRHVLAALESDEVAPTVRERARAVFTRLAAAEAAVHGTTVEKVHFHEVGAADALVDVVGAIEGLEALGVARVYASPPRLGGGTVESEHGPIPVPAPATVELLRGAPVELGPIPVELTTPTGAALLATLVQDWTGPPAFRLERTGVGAGTRDPREWPNVLRVMIGEAGPGASARRRVAVLETSLDDENPQVIAELVPQLLAAGALDAMLVPTVMKKGRPGVCLTVIAEPEAADDLATRLLTGTTSLGVRLRFDQRYELERRNETIETRFGAVALKVALLPGGDERAVPEFESVRAAAERAGRPLREVAEAAVAAWRARAGDAG